MIATDEMSLAQRGRDAALAHLRASRLSESLRCYGSVLALLPAGDAPTWRLMAVVCEAAGDIGGAIVALSHVQDLAPGLVPPLLERFAPGLLEAVQAGRTGGAGETIPFAERLADLFASHETQETRRDEALQLLMSCADASLAHDGGKNVERAYRAVLRHRPRHWRAHVALGRDRCAHGDWVAAVQSYQTALGGAEELDGALFTLIRRDADTITAEAHERLLEAGRNRHDSAARRDVAALYQGLASIATALGEDSTGLEKFARLSAWLAQTDNDPAAQPDTIERCFLYLEADTAADLARRCFRKGNYAEAIKHLQHAVARRQDPQDFAALSQAYLAFGQKHLVMAARWSIATTIDGAATERQVTDTRALLGLVDQTLLLDQNGDANRTDIWAQARGVESWVRYTAALGQHPYRAQGSVTPFTTPTAIAGGAKRRLFDCFTFFNELDMLELRLSELHGSVDHFVLAEATFGHTGHPKPLHFAENRERFAPYLEKIIHIVVDDDPGGFAWRREAHQRDALLRGLEGCADSDMIVVSDADEILRPSVMDRLRDPAPEYDRLFAPELELSMYFLNRVAPEPWLSVAAAPYGLIRKIGTNNARYLPKIDLGQRIPRAGWHFTWIGGAQRFLEKLRSFAHEEGEADFTRNAAENASRLDRFFAEGRGAGAIPGMRSDLRRLEIDAGFPATVRTRLDHYQRLGWIDL